MHIPAIIRRGLLDKAFQVGKLWTRFAIVTATCSRQLALLALVVDEGESRMVTRNIIDGLDFRDTQHTQIQDKTT